MHVLRTNPDPGGDGRTNSLCPHRSARSAAARASLLRRDRLCLFHGPSVGETVGHDPADPCALNALLASALDDAPVSSMRRCAGEPPSPCCADPLVGLADARLVGRTVVSASGPCLPIPLGGEGPGAATLALGSLSLGLFVITTTLRGAPVNGPRQEGVHDPVFLVQWPCWGGLP